MYDPEPTGTFPTDRAERVVVAASLREPVELGGEEYDAGDEVPLDVAETVWPEHGGLLAAFDERGMRRDRHPHDEQYYALADAAREWYDRKYRNPTVPKWDVGSFRQRRRWFAEGKR